MTKPIAWTDQRVEQLKKLWDDGLTASAIVAEMGGNLTRNSVIGKAHRLKLAKRSEKVERARLGCKSSNTAKSEVIKNQHVVRAKRLGMRSGLTSAKVLQSRNAHPSPEVLEVDDDLPDVTNLIGLAELTEHTCKWPLGDPQKPGFGFCGQPSVEGKPYCEFHCKRAYHKRER